MPPLLSDQFDLLILDLGLPKLDGLAVLKRLRARKSRLPVLILTAQDSVEDRIRGLDAGADDYLTKPFALSELAARVRALTRRGTGLPKNIEFGPLAYNQCEGTVRINGQLVGLSPRRCYLTKVTGREVRRRTSWATEPVTASATNDSPLLPMTILSQPVSSA